MNKFFSGIPIYWINLKDSIQRYRSAVDQLKNYKNNLRIEAVDGRDDKIFLENYKINYISKINFTNSLVAVVCSHIRAIKTACNNKLEKVCIFEDDFNLKLLKYYPHTLQDIINKAPPDWEVIQLYYYEIFRNNNENVLTERYIKEYRQKGLQLIKPNPCYSGTSYVINKKGMDKILNNVVNTDGNNKFMFMVPMDSPEKMIFHSLNYYVVNIPPILHTDHTSTLKSYINGIDKKDLHDDQYYNGQRILDFLLHLENNNKEIYRKKKIINIIELKSKIKLEATPIKLHKRHKIIII